jgi:hypothetical protein
MSSQVTIALAAHSLSPDRHLVVAWFSARDGKGTEHTRGLAEVWVGPVREGITRMAVLALDELRAASTVEIVVRRPDPSEPAPAPDTAAALARASGRHTVTYTPVRDAARHQVLEDAERFAAVRGADVVTGPAEAATREGTPAPEPAKVARLF